MFSEPGPHHQWLRRLVGTWAYTHTWQTEAGSEEGSHTGREVVRSLGDLWVIGEGEGVCDGVKMTSVITLGFDPDRHADGDGLGGRYVGSFVASVMPGMFVYEGSREGNVLTLETEGPAMDDATKTVRYRDVVELESESLRTMTSHTLNDDGSWVRFMRGEYRRV